MHVKPLPALPLRTLHCRFRQQNLPGAVLALDREGTFKSNPLIIADFNWKAICLIDRNSRFVESEDDLIHYLRFRTEISIYPALKRTRHAWDLIVHIPRSWDEINMDIITCSFVSQSLP